MEKTFCWYNIDRNKKMEYKTPITEFFTGRSIFITGATGFLGKVLLEKLLRSCPLIDRIYILIRPKKGKPIDERMNELLDLPVFQRVQKEIPFAKNKIIPISGDIMSPRLGIKPVDEKILIEGVSVAFHSAATVRFDETLKIAYLLNTVGTKRFLDLCQKMQKLEAVVHVSTAYSNCYLDEIAEKVYDPVADGWAAIQKLQTNYCENDIDILPDKIADTHPNSYTFTKFLAEKIVADQGKSLPIAIVRPSIVTASCHEPVPGWIDNINGPTGLIIGAAKGLIHTVLCHKNYVVDLIPVDIIANLLISVAWYTATKRPAEVKVFNATTGTLNPTRWSDLNDIMHPIALQNPMEEVFWYPSVRMESSRILNTICAVIFHTIPAYVIDAFYKICDKKPCMVDILKKFQRTMSILVFFTTHQWKFTNDNILLLQSELHPNDQKLFGFNVMDLNWKSYFKTYFYGIKKYILKEDNLSSIRSVNRIRRMYWLHTVCQILLIAVTFTVFVGKPLSLIWYTLVDIMHEALNYI